MTKYYKGDKYIYLLMAITLCKQAGIKGNFSESVRIGNDNGMKGGENYERRFKLQLHDDVWILNESKTSAGFVEYYKSFKIGFTKEDLNKEKPMISDYMNEYEENCGSQWQH